MKCNFQNTSEIQKGKTCNLLLNHVLETIAVHLRNCLFSFVRHVETVFLANVTVLKNEDFQQVLASLQDKTNQSHPA